MSISRPTITLTLAPCMATSMLLGACAEQWVEPTYDRLVHVISEPPGANCEHGGQRIDVGRDDGLDANGKPAGEAYDGKLDPGEIARTNYICSGTVGHDGQDGQDGDHGQDGRGYDSLVRITDVEAQPAAIDGIDGCLLGGQRIDIGLDDGLDRDGALSGEARNGVLDPGEIDFTTFLCGPEIDGYEIAGMLAPGDTLSLEIPEAGAGSKLFAAQVMDNGVIYDHREYSAKVDPVAGRHYFGAPLTTMDNVRAEVLSSGNIVVVWGSYEYSSEIDDYVHSIRGQLLDPTGIAMTSPHVLTEHHADDWTNEDRSGLVTLAGDVFVLMYGSPASYHVFDNTLTEVDSGWLLESEADCLATSRAGNGVVVAYTDNDDIFNAEAGKLQFYTAGMTPALDPITFDTRQVDEIAIQELPTGNFALLWEATEDLDTGGLTSTKTHYGVFMPNGTPLSQGVLSSSYSNHLDLEVAFNGNWVAQFELGGPDTNAYAVLDQNGNFLSPPDVWSDHEPTRMNAGVFGDGSFMLSYLEDDSLAGNMAVVANGGWLETEEKIWTGHEGPDYEHYELLGLGNHEMLAIYAPYEHDAPGQVVRLTKGTLRLEKMSDTQARLSNLTPDTVEVLLAAR